ncbi:transcription factor TFIIIB subunit brf1 [Cyanidiococcus yangmingshanensis]|uniref:B-related factor 1 n=1 Tax=Cyanidiococcus yangmingshanensis TaxID=2690220 RepID=A0A7J7IDI4_9RHOD|nr:transcription factor TFIIIB subunit brf1 [Cyanidiococcus yangmingshanensis]
MDSAGLDLGQQQQPERESFQSTSDADAVQGRAVVMGTDPQGSWDRNNGLAVVAQRTADDLSSPRITEGLQSSGLLERVGVNASTMDGKGTPAASLRRCPSCGSEELEFMSSSGQTTCIVCGQVIEENAVVNELQFMEGAGGHSAVVGQFIRTGSSGTAVAGASTAATTLMLYGASAVGMARLTIGHRESREVTYAAGRRRIATIASQLHLPPRFVDAAHRLFTLAVQHNFVQGRRTQNVAAAALYIVCRREKTPHLLIDFSDALRINVYVLGHTYLKLCRVLHLSLPIIDPSFYIHRFASRLEFGEKQNLVAQTALRLISRMKRDWIHTGRRPAGLCGAALLISARMHGFRRSQREISAVVRVGDMTIRQRLSEIEETPTATLTGRDLESDTNATERLHVDKDTVMETTGDETPFVAALMEETSSVDGCDPPAFRRRQPLPLEWLEQQQHILQQYESSELNAVVDTSLTEQERAFLEASAAAEGQRVPVTVLVASAAPNGSVSNYVGSVCRSEPIRSPLNGTLPSADDPDRRMSNAESERMATDAGPASALEANRRWVSERVEELSDLDSDEEAMFVCTPEETAFREKIWTAMNQEWIEREAEIARWERDDPERYQRLMRKREYMRGFYKSTSATVEANWSSAPTALTAGAVHTPVVTGAQRNATTTARAPSMAAGVEPVRSLRDAVRSAVTHSKRTSKKINYEALEQYDAAQMERHLVSGASPFNEDETVRPSTEPSLFDFGDPVPQTHHSARLPTAENTTRTSAHRRSGSRRSTKENAETSPSKSRARSRQRTAAAAATVVRTASSSDGR